MNYNFIQGVVAEDMSGGLRDSILSVTLLGSELIAVKFIRVHFKKRMEHKGIRQGFENYRVFLSWKAWVDVIPPEEVTPSKKIGLCLAGYCTTACSLMPN